MTVVLDENFPKRIIPILEYRGFSVVDIRSTNDEGMSDQSLFEMAQSLEASIFRWIMDCPRMVSSLSGGPGLPSPVLHVP